MLQPVTEFPFVGSFALIDQPVTGPEGQYTGIRRRRVRVQQVRPDGRLFVTAPGGTVALGLRRIDVAPIQRTVDLADLRPLPRRFTDRVTPR